jgi:glucuronate isomerase
MVMALDEHRLFPMNERARAIAAELFELTSALAIISPHGHVDPTLLLDDQAFPDPASLFVSNDHYVTRMLVSAGLDVPALLAQGSRAVWRAFVENWHRYAGTASAYWLNHELQTLFDVNLESAADPDALYDALSRRLTESTFRPRALFGAVGIELLATTDDPMDELVAHATLAADPGFAGRVIPTFRPDAYLDPSHPLFAQKIDALSDWAGAPADDYVGYLGALEARRAYFIAHGAVSTDHGVLEPYTAELTSTEAAAIFRRAVAGTASAAERREFAGHMLVQMARMSVDDGLVMTIHPGVVRNHSSDALMRLGPDSGHDIPLATSYTQNLRPLLQRYGLEKDFHLVLFSVDESTYSREIAPLAGFYPSVFVGAPWWFLDAPDATLRFRAAVTETAGFYKGSGFIDDTRAFMSIPARHDMARRLDAAYLARLVGEGRVSLAAAHRIAVDLVVDVPRRAFKL